MAFFWLTQGTPMLRVRNQKFKNMVMFEFHFMLSVGVRAHDLKGYAHAGDLHLPQTFCTQGPGPRPEALRLSRKASKVRIT